MSGGPPHHPHNRQVPAANTAWNHLQVPNYFPRQPQLAHMSNEHSLLHQPTWHTPSNTEARMMHSQMLLEMLKNDPLFPRDCVDLSLTRNGNQNGELPPTPISLSVRDTNKINSLPPSELDIQAVELTKCTSPNPKPASPILKSSSPVVTSISPGLKTITGPGVSTQVLPSATSTAPVEGSKTQKRSNIRVDSILERLNTTQEKAANLQENRIEQSVDRSNIIERPSSVEKVEKPSTEKPVSVIVQPASTYDENSNSSSIVNIPTSTCIREEDSVSTYSNEDSLDSNKSRRKRKPSKTIRVSKEDEKPEKEKDTTEIASVSEEPKAVSESVKEPDPVSIVGKMLEENKIPERRRSSDDLETILPPKSRRKTSSESETIDNIAAMVQEGLKAKQMNNVEKPVEDKVESMTKPISVSVIKTKENLTEGFSESLSNSSTILVTPAQKKATNTHFVEVENKLEEMFAGIEDSSDPLKTDTLDLDDSKLEDPLLKLDDPLPSTSQDNVTVSSTTELKKKSPSPKKTKRKAPLSRRNSDANSLETTPKKKKISKKKASIPKGKMKNKKPGAALKQATAKIEPVKDIYAYDSGSNASSGRSRGPFIQIRGPRESPLSVSVVNTPINEEDGERRPHQTKKFHDDREYRQKVRSKGLHCSTLSNKYDAQTKDASWICVFCKRGPHASELSGPTSSGVTIPPGDLFGPYFITAQCPEFEKRLDDPHDKQFKSKKISRVLDESATVKTLGKKSKRKHMDSDPLADVGQLDIYLGITDTGNDTFEIWAHEDCIVWSPGIYLVGPKIVGLEEAVWTSCNMPCKQCNYKGANICCLKRGCLNTVHLCCARSSNWQFLEVDFKAYCPQHRIP